MASFLLPQMIPPSTNSPIFARRLSIDSRLSFNIQHVVPSNKFPTKNLILNWKNRNNFHNFIHYSSHQFVTSFISKEEHSSSHSIGTHWKSNQEILDFKERNLHNEESCNYSINHTLVQKIKYILPVLLSFMLTITPITFSSNSVASFIDHFIISNASAAGLVVMPPSSLNNTYYFMRAGESFWESSGKINTNPVAKTNIDNGLSEKGRKQSILAAKMLSNMNACSDSCWIWPSITQRSYQSAEIVAYVNGITYSRIVPEYSFLDARGLGSYEGKNLSALDDVRMMDVESPNLRPPKYSDGTPNESVNDVLVRVTQLISILETQYSDETVIVISPDSHNLSILESALTGVDMHDHWRLAYAPGEVRKISLNVNAITTHSSGLLKCVAGSCS